MYSSVRDTLFLGQKVVFLPSCHSTNDYLAALPTLAEQPEGLVVITAHQTAGRGQRGSSWISEPGENLTFTILLKPTFLAAEASFLLSIAITLGIHDCLQKFLGEDLKIKWPNDLYFAQQKLGGILIENTLNSTQIGLSIAGIGLNINQIHFELPTATSLKKANPQPTSYDLAHLFDVLCKTLEARYLQLRAGHTTAQRSDYLRAMFRYQEWHYFRDSEGNSFKGQILGIAPNGELAIETHDGLRYFGMKAISFVL